TVLTQPNLILTAIAKITVIPIETGCSPNVYAPTNANTSPMMVDIATSLMCEIDRIIEGCIATTDVITATILISNPNDSVTMIDNATANPVFIILGPILKFIKTASI